jgi:hypothetical protein
LAAVILDDDVEEAEKQGDGEREGRHLCPH